MGFTENLGSFRSDKLSWRYNGIFREFFENFSTVQLIFAIFSKMYSPKGLPLAEFTPSKTIWP